MRGVQTPLKVVNEIQSLRKRGHSVLEISKKLLKSKSIVSKYIQGVSVLPPYINILREKQGGSKIRSEKKWLASKIKAKEIIKELSQRDKILILVALYWGEGTKRELNIINSDPLLLKTFIFCLREIGVDSNDIKATLRIYGDISKQKAIQYWSQKLNLPQKQFYNVNVLEGKKKGKLIYGMCRIRVKIGGEYFKLIMSMIEIIKESFLLP